MKDFHYIAVIPPKTPAIESSGTEGGFGVAGELTAFVVLIGACGVVLREVIRGWSRWMEVSITSASENQKSIIENSKSDQELLRIVFIQQNDRVVHAIEKQTDAIALLSRRIENSMQISWLNRQSKHKEDEQDREKA